MEMKLPKMTSRCGAVVVAAAALLAPGEASAQAETQKPAMVEANICTGSMVWMADTYSFWLAYVPATPIRAIIARTPSSSMPP